MIDTEAIRSKILQLAFSGKLTYQQEDDGTGEDLFAELQKTKKTLDSKFNSKKQEIVNEADFPFEIPNSWMWVRLKSLCTKIIDGNHNPPAGVNYKTEYVMLSAQNIIKDSISNLDKVRYITKDIFEEENRRTNLEKGDILLTIVGTLGRSCVFDGNENYCFQRSVSVIHALIDPYSYNKVVG